MHKTKNKRKYRINIKKMTRFILVMIIACAFISTFYRYFIYNADVIAESVDHDYIGTGQEYVKDGIGYFTTFTTSDGKKYTEYKQNGDAPWADNEYWGDSMKNSGCGITALSIVLSGYGIDADPEELRKQYYPKMEYSDLQKEFADTFGIKAGPFVFDNENLSEDKIVQHLCNDKPLLICVWDEQGKNRWTKESHYMVLLAADGKGKVYVSNPNGLLKRKNSSGWYDAEEVVPYIAKAIYINE